LGKHTIITPAAQKTEAKARLIAVAGDVRFGSKADIGLAQVDVRFTPESGHCSAQSQCPLCAKSGLMHCPDEHGLLKKVDNDSIQRWWDHIQPHALRLLRSIAR
jgi:hypothetical protein